jgi:hypothetical protein
MFAELYKREYTVKNSQSGQLLGGAHCWVSPESQNIGGPEASGPWEVGAYECMPIETFPRQDWEQQREGTAPQLVKVKLLQSRLSF